MVKIFHFFLIGIFCILFFLASREVSLLHAQQPAVSSPPHPLVHMIGGFSIQNDQDVNDAARDGVQLDFKYGDPPVPASDLGKALQKANMHVVDGYIWSQMYYYLCHLAWQQGNTTYCKKDFYPYMDLTALYASVSAHADQVKTNSLVLGYWVLDDDPPWARQYAGKALEQIHAILHQKTPSIPAVCGFGGEILPFGSKQSFSFDPGVFDVFSASNLGIIPSSDPIPQYCDMLAFYIYSSSERIPPVLTYQDYDWTMPGMLEEMKNQLKTKYNWNQQEVPFMGIAQAWAGPRKDLSLPYMEATPSAESVDAQASSFCEKGAVSIVFYGWADSSSDTFPNNNAGLKNGIKKAVADCRSIWNGGMPTKADLTVHIDGIDNQNLMNIPGLIPSKHTTRTVTLYFYPYMSILDTSASPLYIKKDTVTQLASDPHGTLNGFFRNPAFDISGVPSGNYIIIAKAEGTTTSELIQRINPNQPVPISLPNTGSYNSLVDIFHHYQNRQYPPPLIVPTLLPGKIADLCSAGTAIACPLTSKIGILDYNAMVDCFGNKKGSASCVVHGAYGKTKDSLADLNDDGIINGIDYTILLKNFGK